MWEPLFVYRHTRPLRPFQFWGRPMKTLLQAALVVVCLAATTLSAQDSTAPALSSRPAQVVPPFGRTITPRPIFSVSNLGTGINYHDGPVMTSNGENVYFIWYGN